MGLSSLESNSNHVIPLKLRPDLQIFKQSENSSRAWVVRDPVASRYFAFSDEEFEILRCLNGEWTPQMVKSAFETRFAPKRLPIELLNRFLFQLHRHSLVLSSHAGQAETLLQRSQQQRKERFWGQLASPLAIRVGGFDPTNWLDRIYPWIRPWLSKPAMLTYGLLVMAALVLLVWEWQSVRMRLPQIQQWLGPQNWFWLAAVLAIMKMMHELGHALVCKHFGGHCREMGVLILAGTPCLYCDVSDSWILPSRWHRLAIASAGIATEWILASVCLFLWWYLQPGLVQNLCLNVVAVCSLGTFLLNANPLMRLDGYFILSDLLGERNLWQRSRSALGKYWRRFFFGPRKNSDSQDAKEPSWLALYGLASVAYQFCLLFGLLYWVYWVLTPAGWTPLAHAIAVMSLAGISIAPIRRVVRFFSNPIAADSISPKGWRRAIAIAAGLLIAFFWLPLPCRVGVPATLQVADATRIYVTIPGRLVESATIGQRLQTGDLIAKLENLDVQKELQQVEGQWHQQRMRLRGLEGLRSQNPQMASQIPSARQILDDLDQRRIRLRDQAQALELRAPIAGTVIPAPSRRGPKDDPRALRTWERNPLMADQLGCELERQTLVCLVGDPERMEAVLAVPQSIVPQLTEGQKVRVGLEMAPGRILTGKIREISRNPVEVGGMQSDPVDWQLGVASAEIEQGWTETTLYIVFAELESSQVGLPSGSVGWARITVDPQPLAEQLRRWLARWFRPIF